MNLPNPMPITPWKILESSHPRKNLRVDQCELPNDFLIEKMIFEFGTWANIVAITKEQQVVLIKQYRHGIGKIIWEIPGGAVEPGESPLQAAGRELLEETGYSAASLIELGALSPNPDNHINLMHTFLALNAERISAQDLDATEEIDVFLIPVDEVIRMATSGELLSSMNVGSLFLALAYLHRIAS